MSRINSAFDAYILSAFPSQQKRNEDSELICNLSPSSGNFATLEAAGQSGRAVGKNTKRACDRCRRHKTKCDEGRPCRRCAGKTIGQTCLDCDIASQASAKDGPGVNTVARGPEFQSKVLVLPDKGEPAAALTKSEVFAKQFGRGVWINHNTSAKIVEGMSDELLDVVMKSLEALRVCKDAFCRESNLLPAPSQPQAGRGVVLKVLDDDYCADPLCVEEFYIGTCKTCGLSFNRRFAEDIMDCSADELLARVARGDVGFSMTEVESLCLIMDAHVSAHAMHYSKYHFISPGLMKGSSRKSPLFVHQKTTITLDVPSRVARCELRVIPVSEQEYDQARLADPSCCRPFMAAVGDLRSSRQLLRDRPGDVRMTFAKMRHTVEGRELQRDLAAAIREKYSWMTAQAVQLSAESFVRHGVSSSATSPTGDDASPPLSDGNVVASHPEEAFPASPSGAAWCEDRVCVVDDEGGGIAACDQLRAWFEEVDDEGGSPAQDSIVLANVEAVLGVDGVDGDEQPEVGEEVTDVTVDTETGLSDLVADGFVPSGCEWWDN